MILKRNILSVDLVNVTLKHSNLKQILMKGCLIMRLILIYWSKLKIKKNKNNFDLRY